jgi:hypothetical protein
MNKPEGGMPIGGEAEKSKERRDYELACKYLEIARKAATSAVDFLMELHTKKDLNMNDLTRVQSGIESEVFYPLCDLSSLGQSTQYQAYKGFDESGKRSGENK